jgi:hypothetical protein
LHIYPIAENHKMNLAAIQEIVKVSDKYIEWGIAMFVGSLLALLSTSYTRPPVKSWRLIYLLYLPAWSFLGVSIMYGDKIKRRGLVAAIEPERIPTITVKVDSEFWEQLCYFKVAMVFFGIWLVTYLFWWTFGKPTPHEK